MCIFVPSIYAMVTIKQIKIKGYFGKGHFKARTILAWTMRRRPENSISTRWQYCPNIADWALPSG